MHQITAVAQDDTDDRLHKQGHQHPQKHGGAGEIHIGVFVFPVELLEGPQLLALLDKGLDHGNAREALLGEVGQVGEGLLSDIPLLHHVLADHRADPQQKQHGNQREEGEQRVHGEHLPNGHAALQNRVEEHQEARTIAILHGVQVVGEQAHQVAHLVDLVILPGQILGMVEHAVAQVGFHLDGRAEDAHAPHEAPRRHRQNDKHQRHADFVQQEIHVERAPNAVHHDIALVDPVDDHLIKIGHDQLEIIHHGQHGKAQQQPWGIPEVIAVDMLAEDHKALLFCCGDKQHTASIIDAFACFGNANTEKSDRK